MKKLLFILIFSSSVYSQINWQLAGEAHAIHNFPDCTVRQYLRGPAGSFDPQSQTWCDTAWAGTPGFNFVEKVGFSLSPRAEDGILKLLKLEMARQKTGGGLKYTLTDGSSGCIVKAVSESANNSACEWLLLQFRDCPDRTEVEGIFKYPEKNK